MKRKILLIIIAVSLILAVGTLTMFLNSNVYYSKKLISAIREENIVAVQQIIEKKPTCINTYPSVTAKLWNFTMSFNRVCYPLTEACGTGNVELIELLIKNGADVNCNDGLTPLSVTYNSKTDNWYEISQILIEHGASLNYITDYSGGKSSVLHDIVKVRSGSALPGYVPESQEEVNKSFYYALENCNHDKIDWMRVLQNSVTYSRMEIVKFLLEEGYCDVNDSIADMTALMFAARDSNAEMVQLLLDFGADKTRKDCDGMTALDYAIKYNEMEVVKLLE